MWWQCPATFLAPVSGKLHKYSPKYNFISRPSYWLCISWAWNSKISLQEVWYPYVSSLITAVLVFLFPACAYDTWMADSRLTNQQVDEPASLGRPWVRRPAYRPYPVGYRLASGNKDFTENWEHKELFEGHILSASRWLTQEESSSNRNFLEPQTTCVPCSSQ